METAVVTERPLTLFLNAREIVTMMTIGDRPDLLAVGYLLNQNMLKADDEITAVDYEDDIATVVVRTRRQTDFEDKLKKKTQTSGCAQGTVFGDLMEEFDKVELNPAARVKTSWLYQLTKKINTQPSLYLKAGAIHGCVLAQEDRPLIYMEDVGRHNAVDKIAGYMFLNGIAPGRQDFLHHRPAHLRDGDQDREDAHPRAGLALGLHGLGRGAGAQGRAHADRPRARQALRGARRARSASSSTPIPRRPRTRTRSTPARAAMRKRWTRSQHLLRWHAELLLARSFSLVVSLRTWARNLPSLRQARMRQRRESHRPNPA